MNLIEPWVWPNLTPVRDGATVIKGGENARPGREGVFRMPLAYASETPAGGFFGLGDEEEETAKKASYYERALAKAAAMGPAPEPWCPDFRAAEAAGAESAEEAVARDEWDAWY